MQKTAQAWFTGGPSSATFNDDQVPKPSSLLADWKSYAAASQQESDSSGFDLESAVHTTTDKVSGTFDVVSKAVRDLPGSFQSAPSGKSMTCFGLLVAAGVFFIFIAFTMFLPVIVLVPQKFAICFTVGCALIVSSFFALKGPKNQLAHMTSKERLPFTLGTIGSMVGTIYVSMVLHSYFLSVIFSVLQEQATAMIRSGPCCPPLLKCLSCKPYVGDSKSLQPLRTWFCPNFEVLLLHIFCFKIDLAFGEIEVLSMFLGHCTIILCFFLLPGRICWTEVSFFNSYLFNSEVFWKTNFGFVIQSQRMLIVQAGQPPSLCISEEATENMWIYACTNLNL